MEEFLVDRMLTNKEITQTLSQLLAIDPTSIVVVEDITETGVVNTARIVVEHMPVQGDFVEKITLYFDDSDLDANTLASLPQRIADELGCACLMSDDSSNPYTWLLIKPRQTPQQVSLDPQRLDDEEFVIVR